MENLVYLVMAHGTTVITSLLGAIILCVFALLLMSFHSPKDSIASDVGSVERLEGVLRQILADQDWPKGAPEGASIEGENAQVALLKDQLQGMENEVREKQKQLDAAAVSGIVAPAAPLQEKVKELESKLAEYSVIEEDIADLSRFRHENEELKKKISEVAGISVSEAASMPWDEFEKIVKDKKAQSAKDTVTTSVPMSKTE